MRTRLWPSPVFSLRQSGNASRFQSDEYMAMVDAARPEPDGITRIALYRQIEAFVKGMWLA
jgi:hypothetical protein